MKQRSNPTSAEFNSIPIWKRVALASRAARVALGLQERHGDTAASEQLLDLVDTLATHPPTLNQAENALQSLQRSIMALGRIDGLLRGTDKVLMAPHESVKQAGFGTEAAVWITLGDHEEIPRASKRASICLYNAYIAYDITLETAEKWGVPVDGRVQELRDDVRAEIQKAAARLS